MAGLCVFLNNDQNHHSEHFKHLYMASMGAYPTGRIYLTLPGVGFWEMPGASLNSLLL